jgi:hypothetical protein
MLFVKRTRKRHVASALVVGAIAGVSTSHAADAAPALPRQACTISPWVNLEAATPYKNGMGKVISTGGVWYRLHNGGPLVPAYCGSIQLRIEAQTEISGFWGTNWHSRGHWGFSGNGRTESPWRRSTEQTCREGTHRYRTVTRYEHGFVQFEWQQPVATIVDSFNGSSPLLTCTNGK